jgi:hypothetical protein
MREPPPVSSLRGVALVQPLQIIGRTLVGGPDEPFPMNRCSDAGVKLAMGRVSGEADKVRRYGDFRYAAKSWTVERRVIARVEANPKGPTAASADAI